MPNEWQRNLDVIVEQLTPDLVKFRRHLHAHPEPSGHELATSLEIYQRIGAFGLETRLGPDGCGVIADSRGGSSSQRVAFRADIDALLIQDEKQTPYRSTRDGVMHACGHDAHAAIALGVVQTLTQMESRGLAPWPLAWRAIFQPAEETAAGARQMIEAGALDGVRQIFALHVDPARCVGEIGIRTGAFTANCDDLSVTVHGRGGHGARPHESRDPIAAAALLISTLYQFVPRATNSLDAVVVSFGRVAGGENSNVIPEHVELGGTIRTLDALVRAQTIDHVRRLVRGIEEISSTEIDVTFKASTPSVQNDAQSTSIIAEVAKAALGPSCVQEIPRPSMGSEDFACYLDHAPGAMFRLGVASSLEKITPLHTPRFDIDERALALGVRILAGAVVLACGPASGGP